MQLVLQVRQDLVDQADPLEQVLQEQQAQAVLVDHPVLRDPLEQVLQGRLDPRGLLVLVDQQVRAQQELQGQVDLLDPQDPLGLLEQV